MTYTRWLSVEGLVSGAYLVEVVERLRAIDGVTWVGMTLNGGGRSPRAAQCAHRVTHEELQGAVAGVGNFSLAHSRDRGATGGRFDDVVFAADRFAKGGVR